MFFCLSLFDIAIDACLKSGIDYQHNVPEEVKESIIRKEKYPLHREKVPQHQVSEIVKFIVSEWDNLRKEHNLCTGSPVFILDFVEKKSTKTLEMIIKIKPLLCAVSTLKIVRVLYARILEMASVFPEEENEEDEDIKRITGVLKKMKSIFENEVFRK